MEWLLIGIARCLLPLVRRLSLPNAARLGRWGGGWAWRLDRRHRRVALANLERCFPRMEVDIRRAIAEENFRRIGENYCTGIRAAGMRWDEIQPHLDLGGLEELRDLLDRHQDRSVIAAIGHFGNFELFTWLKRLAPERPMATTYRALRQKVATRLLLGLREQSGCLFFERRREGTELREALRNRRILLGLLADQHEGRGPRLPFLGQEASTSTAPAVLALRYGCPLVTVFCYRVSLARWRMEFGTRIATRDSVGRPRPTADIAGDMNRSFESAIRKDPANWFWVHRRWKPAMRPRSERQSQKAPGTR